MRVATLASISGLVAALAITVVSCFAAQDAPVALVGGNTPQIVTDHPFTAIKYALRVEVLPSGELRFIRNERYPTRIARDSAGRLMMQVIHELDRFPECNRLDMPVPPACPVRTVFVIDPVAQTLTHWNEGERGGKAAADFPLTQARLEEAGGDTSLPAIGPDFGGQDGEVKMEDLGDEPLEGIAAHGVRWTLRFDTNEDGRVTHRTRIHEVWTSEEMQLILLVIDGDPKGEETVCGLKDISLAPEASLFRSPYDPPEGYGTHHNATDAGGRIDFGDLKSWFAQ